jgi:hypothetical protein
MLTAQNFVRSWRRDGSSDVCTAAGYQVRNKKDNFMINRRILLGFAALATLVPATAALAQRVSTFYIINQSDKTIIGVQGNSGRGWSDNWLPDNRPLTPGGDGILIRFNGTSDRCELTVRVTYEDERTTETQHSFCNINALYVGAQDIWTE